MLSAVPDPVEYAGREAVAPLCAAASACWGDRATLHPGNVWWSASPHHGSVVGLAGGGVARRLRACRWPRRGWRGRRTPRCSRRTRIPGGAAPRGGGPLGGRARRPGPDHGRARPRPGDGGGVEASGCSARPAHRSSWLRDTHDLVVVRDPAPPPGHLVRPVADTVVDRAARVRAPRRILVDGDHPSGYDVRQLRPAEGVAALPPGAGRRGRGAGRPPARERAGLVGPADQGRPGRAGRGAPGCPWSRPGPRGRARRAVGPACRGRRAGRGVAAWATRRYPGPARLYAACGFVAGPRTVTMRRRR